MVARTACLRPKHQVLQQEVAELDASPAHHGLRPMETLLDKELLRLVSTFPTLRIEQSSQTMDDDREFEDRVAWKALRKQGMGVENQLQTQLDKYAHLPVTISKLSKSHNQNAVADLIETKSKLEKDISNKFTQLGQIEGEMASMTRQRASNDSQSRMYTFQRFQSVVQGCQQEYNRTKTSVEQALTRIQLLEGRGGESFMASSSVQTLLREQSSMERSLKETDHVIELAQASHKDLGKQRSTLAESSGKMGKLGAAFPRINALMGRIKSHRFRDTIILAFVIATCMLFTIVYWSRKE
jgi:Golgi SNAP receptor complex protein 1